MNRLIDAVRQGNRRAVARLITQVENETVDAREALKDLYKDTGRAHLVGITGPPGSGKSTLVNEIAKVIRKHDLLLGIVAVDPSSPFTGGALLGDRVRMRDLSGDHGIFIRSMASRGSLGGLATTTGNVVRVLDAAGFDIILIETVGAGQAEVDIAGTAHTTLVIESPGMGDEVQSIKAGILEIADILVVNKADKPGSKQTVQVLRAMLQMNGSAGIVNHHGTMMASEQGATPPAGAQITWSVPLLETIASDGKGIDEVVEAITAHGKFLKENSGWMAKEIVRSRNEISRLLQARFLASLHAVVPPTVRDETINAVARRELDPYTAVERLFNQTTI